MNGASGSADHSVEAGCPPPPAGDMPKGKKDKRLSVERIYQKKSQLEHILLRPDTYIGSVNPVTEKMWVLDSNTNRIVNREITYVPGLYKIFDEILVNAADNKVRDPKMDTIRIDINPEKNEIKVFNNGKGIPVEHHKDEKMYVPTLIFGHLLTSSNFNDEEQKVTGGRNGYGAKLCNVFSNKFVVETANKKKEFKQKWEKNMTKAGDYKLKEDYTGDDYTRITFCPDLAKFSMEKLDEDTISLLSRRAYDIAASTRGGVKVYLNDKKVAIKAFKDYIDFFLKDKEDETGNQVKAVYEHCSDRWEVAVAVSGDGFHQMSFVNSIATTKGGRHIDYISKMLENNIAEVLKKKNKGGITVKPHQIRNHMWVFVNCLIVNPTFDSQTKENMTLQQSKFGSKCQLSSKFMTALTKSGIVESVLAWSKFKQDQEMKSKHSSKKTNKLRGISKLEDANDAGTRNSMDCTLILTEGDSAKTLAVAGLSIVGRDRYGVFPLRGKLLNVREASHKQIMDNKEINEMVKIIGLQYKKRYATVDDMKSLRYGKLMIMTDQDQDGSHIKGLLINFIHHNWPSLLKLPFLEEFITPIVKATKGGNSISFYSLPEFSEWKEATNNWHTYKIKYYKGLGTSTSKEAKEYFSDMRRHRILFSYQSEQDDDAINMAFSKKATEQRKEWLTSWMEECKRRKSLNLPEIYLYEKNTRSVSYSDFVNKELVLFSNLDNERSIPCLVDGFKPGQRKVMFTCFKRNDKREVKVAQLAGSVGEMSAYHHGEASLMGTIINLAQDFVGSNNINLLQPIGQFGTRLAGGKDAASPRYIFTQMSTLTRLIFNQNDDPLLNYLTDDNQKIEPEWYVPILPMVLVNGADGIGTGWMTKIPNYDPRAIVKNILRMLDGLDPNEMDPSFKGFTGTITNIGEQKYVVSGEISSISDNRIEITELPIRTWTQTYKEQTMEPMLNGSEKSPAVIQDYKEYHTDKTVKFVVQMAADKLRHAEQDKGLHQYFKLQSTMSTSSMVLFDAKGCLRRYESASGILQEFFDLRLEFYSKRKDFMEGMLQAEARKLSNQARFILEKCDGILTIENKKKKVMIEELRMKGYDSDPVKKWKKSVADGRDEQDAGNSDDEDFDNNTDFDYLLGMAMWNLTKEKKDELIRKRDEKQQELNILLNTSKEELWRHDLKEFLEKLDEVEQKEKDDDLQTMSKAGGRGKAAGDKKGKKAVQAEALPSPAGFRVAPRIPEELRSKAAKAAQAKEKKSKKGRDAAPKDDFTERDEFDMMCDEKDLSLSEKLGFDFKKSKGPSKKRVLDSDSDDDYGPSAKADSDDSDYDMFRSATKSKKAPKPDKKSSDNLFGGPSKDNSDKEDFKPKSKPAPKKETKAKAPAKPKAAPKPKQPKKMKKKASSDDDDFSNDDVFSDDDVPKKKKAKTTAAKGKPKKKKNAWESDSDADMFEASDADDSADFSAPVEKKDRGGLRRGGGTAAPKKKYTFSSEDEDEDDEDDFRMDDYKPKKAAAAAPKSKKKKKRASSDEDDSFMPSPESSPKASRLDASSDEDYTF